MEGFMVPQFVPKEMAITDGERTAHYIFKPPFPFRRLAAHHRCDVKYLTKNRHGIPWYSGSVDISEIDTILRHVGERDNIIYCKGVTLCDFLRQHTNLPVLNVEDLDDVREWKPPCFAHKNLNVCSCALNTVAYLYGKLSK